MPQALITVNSTPGSNDSLPLNTLVQLNNQNIGGELSYLWQILDQPPGTADTLSSSSVQNPSFTPKKEGTYLVRLTVNQALPTEQSNQVVCAIRQLKTLQRIPAAGETTEDSSVQGWAASMNLLLRSIDALLADPGVVIGKAKQAGLVRGNILRATSSEIIKPGLPGQETVSGFTLADATTLADCDELLVALEGNVAGSSTPANGDLIRCRYLGPFLGIAGVGGAVGDPVFLTNGGGLSSTPGTTRRQIGSVQSVGSGAVRDVFYDGRGNVDVTPIDAPYVVKGSPGTLTNAFRIDGSNATAATGGVSPTFKSGDASTVALTVKGGDTANIQDWRNSAGAIMASVGPAGLLTVLSAAVTGALSAASAAITGMITGANATLLATASNGDGVDSTGNGSGSGVAGLGGSASGVGLYGVGGNPNGSGVRGVGVGSGTGIIGAGGASGGSGIAGTGGTADGMGVTGLGAGAGTGVRGTGGATSGNGVAGVGGAPNGSGVHGLGTGTGYGVIGEGGTTSGSGVTGVGGTPNGVGVSGTGSGTGTGLVGTGGASDGKGIVGYGIGAGSGVEGHVVTGSGIGVKGTSDSGEALHGESISGYALKLYSNSTHAPIHLQGQSSAPSAAQAGDVYFDSGTLKLYVYTGSTWEPLN